MVIYNPVAGSRDARRDLSDAVGFLRGEGWELTVRETYGQGDATTYAREAVVSGCNCVLVAAGDGTLREAVDGLTGTDVALGTLPIGHSNVWARQIRLPVWSPLRQRALLEASEAVLTSQVRRIDVGKAGQKHFLQWAGIGFDAQVAERMEPHLTIKRRLGTFAYVIASLTEALTLVGRRVTLTVDGNRFRDRALLIIVSNARLYGRFMRIASLARLDDGQLDVCVFKGQGTVGMFRHVGRIFMQKHLSSPQVEYHRGRRIKIQSSDPMPAHLDGDPLDRTPLGIEVIPRALNVLIPPHAPPELFTDSSA